MADLEYPIVIQALSEEDGGGYVAFVPDLKGCVGDGATQEEAVSDARSAIKEWIDETVRLGRAVPPPNSAARKVAKERHDLLTLVKAQDAFLRTQTDALREAQAEVDDIRKRLHILECVQVDDDESQGWASAVALLPAHIVKAKTDSDGHRH